MPAPFRRALAGRSSNSSGISVQSSGGPPPWFVTGTFVQEPAPPAEGAAAWFLEGTAPFLETMTALDPRNECWNFGPPPRTARFWLRRQAHEHAIHLVDACQALGLEIPALADDFMLDGVDEVLAMFAPRQLRLDRMPHPDKAVTFQVPGAASWTLGPGPAVASISAPLPVMYLGLWGRSNLAETPSLKVTPPLPCACFGARSHHEFRHFGH